MAWREAEFIIDAAKGLFIKCEDDFAFLAAEHAEKVLGIFCRVRAAMMQVSMMWRSPGFPVCVCSHLKFTVDIGV